jgi:hypothetical protein
MPIVCTLGVFIKRFVSAILACTLTTSVLVNVVHWVTLSYVDLCRSVFVTHTHAHTSTLASVAYRLPHVLHSHGCWFCGKRPDLCFTNCSLVVNSSSHWKHTYGKRRVAFWFNLVAFCWNVFCGLLWCCTLDVVVSCFMNCDVVISCFMYCDVDGSIEVEYVGDIVCMFARL